MVNYQNAKVLSFGIKDHKNNDPNTFILSSTLNTTVALADIKRKYKNFLAEKSPHRYFYDIIEKIGVDNLTVQIVESRECETKQEVNSFFTRVLKQITTSTESQITENKIHTVAEITLKRYSDNINVLKKKMEKTDDPLFLNDAKTVIEFINSSGWAVETQKNYLKAILATFSYDDDPIKMIYRAEMNRLIFLAQLARDNHILSVAQIEKWVDYEDIRKITENLYLTYKNTGIASTDLIIALFFGGKMFAPFRLAEFCKLKMPDGGDFVSEFNYNADNYIDANTDTIVLNNYKTYETYGKYTQKISPNFTLLLYKYFDAKDNGMRNPQNYLILDDDCKPITTNWLNARLNSIFGCSCNLLRKSYITHLLENEKLVTNAQKKAVAKQMRDGVETMLSYARIDSPATEIIQPADEIL